MRISTRGRYGMRAMMELALRDRGGPVLLADIARAQGISRKYLEQIFASLRKAGLIRGVRGAAGGYEFTRDPDEIKVGDILRALEGPIEPVKCLSRGYACSRSGACATQIVWREVGEAISGVLDRWTLGDLAREQQARSQAASLMYHI